MHRTAFARTQRRTVAHWATRTTLRTWTLENWLTRNRTSHRRTCSRRTRGRIARPRRRRRIHGPRPSLRNNQAASNRLSRYRSSRLHRPALWRTLRGWSVRRSNRRSAGWRSDRLCGLRLLNGSCGLGWLRGDGRSRNNNPRRLARLRRDKSWSGRRRLLRNRLGCFRRRHRLRFRRLRRSGSNGCRFNRGLRRRRWRSHRLQHRGRCRSMGHSRGLWRLGRLHCRTRRRDWRFRLLMDCF